LQRLAANTGQRAPQLDNTCPAHTEYLWAIFNSLGRASSNGFEGISQAEIAAWQSNHSARLTSWELDTLKALDNQAAVAAAKQRRQSQT
jgi:hypothetical protein